jgi:predicted phage terminase large subunit-like protein
LELSQAEVEVRKEFVRQASRESFYFFAKQVLGYDKLTNQTHKKWADELQSKWLQVDRFMRLKPRGTYKTTLYGISFLLWVWACVSPEIRFFYTSANRTLLEEVGAELDRFIGDKSESLVATVFGLRRDPALKNTADVFNIVGKQKSKGSSLMFRTAGGSTNGVHPHVIICDDPMDKEDRESEAVRASKERWFDSLTPLLVPYDMKLSNGEKMPIEKLMFISTRWHLKDLVSYVRAKGDDWDFEEEGVYNADGSPRYPEFFGEAEIQKKKRAIHSVFFACQYLNNPLPEGLRVFVEDRLHFVRPEQISLAEGTIYNFFDPSQGKSGGDFPASIWVHVNNGRKVVFDAIDDKIELTSLLGMIAAKNKQYGVMQMQYETNGTMGLHKSLELAHNDAGYPAIMIEGIHETRNKEERIYAMQPALYRGDWYFMADFAKRYPELMNQLIFFPAWGHDDFPDVIEKGVTWVANNMPDLDRLLALGAS